MGHHHHDGDGDGDGGHGQGHHHGHGGGPDEGHHHHHHGGHEGCHCHGHGDGGHGHHHHGEHPDRGGGGRDGGDRPGPRNVDLELSQMLGSRAAEMTREIVLEVLRDAIKEEVRKLPELQALAARTARELAEDMRLSLQIEELIAQRDEKRERSKAERLAAMLGKDKAGG